MGVTFAGFLTLIRIKEESIHEVKKRKWRDDNIKQRSENLHRNTSELRQIVFLSGVNLPKMVIKMRIKSKRL